MLLVLFAFVVPAAAQGLPLSVNLGTGLPMPIGQTSTVAVTVTNIVNTTVQLTFVGLRFEWDKPGNFFIGANSEKGAVLAAGEQIVYAIPVQVPGNTTPGTHRLSTYATYRMLAQGNWTGVLAGWWVADVQLAYPQTQQGSQIQQSRTATGAGSQQPFSIETIGVLIAVLAIGLFLERARIKRLLRRPQGAKPEPTEPESREPEAAKKEEEDL
jgi:hypothetical protein